MLESGIGRAHNVALASLPNFSLPGDLSPSSRYWARDIVTPEWTMDAEGMVHVPLGRPGLGVTVNVDRIDDINYKDVRLLNSFISERGKITPRRISGVCAPHQRRLSDAIKKARNIALLPFAASF